MGRRDLGDRRTTHALLRDNARECDAARCEIRAESSRHLSTFYGVKAQRISATALHALMDALATVFWYKRDLRSFLVAATGDPTLIARLDWSAYKRAIVEQLVQHLATHPERYHDLLLRLIVDVAQMDDFPKLRGIEDSAAKTDAARDSVRELRKYVKPYEEELMERERARGRIAKARAAADDRRYMQAKLDELKERYQQLVVMDNPQARGLALEPLLRDLFALFDLDPRAAFKLKGEQIDGSVTVGSTHFLVEAKWTKEPTDRKELDAFRAKVETKLENTLGLFVSINSFQESAVSLHSGRGALMLLMTGADLYAVLDGRVDLVELLGRKHRHASQTGEVLIEAHQLVGA
jgi:hypothetical protein